MAPAAPPARHAPRSAQRRTPRASRSPPGNPRSPVIRVPTRLWRVVSRVVMALALLAALSPPPAHGAGQMQLSAAEKQYVKQEKLPVEDMKSAGVGAPMLKAVLATVEGLRNARGGVGNVGAGIATFFLGQNNCVLKLLFFRYLDREHGEDDFSYMPKACFEQVLGQNATDGASGRITTFSG